jgi:nitrite reductase/ring-hydroxylating ferredoxin subunit
VKTYNWFKIAENDQEILFNNNNITEVQVNGKVMALGRHHDKLFAFAHKCPHAGGPMKEGWIDAKGNVVCPVHGYRFSLENGRNVSGEGYNLKHWPVESRPDGIFVGIEEGLFNWL